MSCFLHAVSLACTRTAAVDKETDARLACTSPVGRAWWDGPESGPSHHARAGCISLLPHSIASLHRRTASPHGIASSPSTSPPPLAPSGPSGACRLPAKRSRAWPARPRPRTSRPSRQVLRPAASNPAGGEYSGRRRVIRPAASIPAGEHWHVPRYCGGAVPGAQPRAGTILGFLGSGGRLSTRAS
jgi:hypothetical protein